MSECKHGVDSFEARGCYNCVCDDNDQLRQQIATLQKEALKVYQLDGSCVEMETAEKVVEFRKGCAKLLQTQAQEIDTLQKDNSNLKAEVERQSELLAGLEGCRNEGCDAWIRRMTREVKKAEEERDVLISQAEDHAMAARRSGKEVERLREALLQITVNRFGSETVCNTPDNRATCGAIQTAIKALNHKEK